jgi:HEAT repeat protein
MKWTMKTTLAVVGVATALLPATPSTGAGQGSNDSRSALRELQSLNGLAEVSALRSLGAQQETAEQIYRDARRELNSRNYERAATMFERIRMRYRNSAYAADAYYWEAFARHRTDETDQLETALGLLEMQRQRHPNASTMEDARSLAVRIEGRLAERGDARAAQGIMQRAQPQEGGCPEEEDDTRLMALNALMNMDAERAVPILQRVLERRDACSVKLRRRAVWLISQQHTADATSLLLDVARNDPDREVQEQAVFWLSQVHSDEAVNALDSILMESDDQKIQEKAIFSLSQHDSPRAAAILRRYVERTDAPEKLRENAIFWLGQSDRGENQEFLRELYGRVTSEGLKDKIIFGLSQHGSEEAAAFLLEIALNRAESIKLRKSALFWAGQTEEIPAERLDELYDSIDGREMREQVIFVLSQRHEREAVDALMNIQRAATLTALVGGSSNEGTNGQG